MNKENLIQFLKKFDAFGETHTFRVNTEKTYNSPFGGCLCLIFLIYSFIYVIYTFNNFITGQYKTKEYDLKILPSPEINILDHKYFSIAFCLRKENYGVDDYLQNSLETKLFYDIQKLNDEKTLINYETEIILKNCEEMYTNSNLTQHQKDYWAGLNKFQISGCKCVNFEDLKSDYILSSNYEGIEKSYFYFDLKYKENYGNLTSIKNVSDYIEDTNPYMHVYFPEYSANMSSISEPLQIKMHTEAFSISPKVSQNSFINFGLLSFTDYYSYTTDRVHLDRNKIIYDSRSSTILNSLRKNSLLKISFNLSGNMTTYIRNFMKLQEYLANTIGYLWNIILLVYLFSSIYNTFGSQRFLAEKFFWFNKELNEVLKKDYVNKLKSPRKKKSDDYAKYSPQEQEMEHKVAKDDGTNSNNLEVNLNKSEVNHDISIEGGKGQNQGVEMSDQSTWLKNKYTIYFWQYFINFIPSFFGLKSKDEKYNLIRSGEFFYYYYMDISFYLKMVMEFTIIKRLVLSKEKRKMLNRLKPFLKSDYQEEYENKLKKMYNDKLGLKEVKCIQQGIKSLVDEDQKASLESISNFI